MTEKMKLATTSLAGCFGCHMSILDIDERILDLIKVVEFDRSPINDIKVVGRADVGIIEGGVANTDNVETLQAFRDNCDVLVALGACAVNGGIPAIDCLPDVAEAAGDVPVLFDSGIRSGADIIKALALGATAVGIGRPYAYGAALAGTAGIVHVLRSLLAEADLIMAIDGYPTLADLAPGALRRVRK